MSELSQERLKEFLHYNPVTGLFTWAKIPSKYVSFNVGDIAGSTDSDGYVQICLHQKKHYAHRLANLYMKGRWPTHQMDHLNHIRDDNRWSNLREATIQENQRNASMRNDNMSGVMGVCWERRRSKWHVRIYVNGKATHIGHFNSKAAAIAARKAAEIKYGYHANHGMGA